MDWRVAEVDRDVGGDGEAAVGGYLGALVPGQRAFQVRWQCLHGRLQGVADFLRTAAIRQVDEQHVAGAALNQSADGGGAVLADDQVSLPVPGHRPVSCLGRPLADHHHGVGEPLLPLLGLTAWPAPGTSGAQGTGQFTTQLAAALDVEGLVDGLMDHVHLRPVGKACPKSLADLLRAPAFVQVELDEDPQFRALPYLPRLRPGPAGIGASLGGERAVVPLAAGPDSTVAVNLPADGRGTPAQLSGDRADRRLLPEPVGDVDPLMLRQVPGLLDDGCRTLDVSGHPLSGNGCPPAVGAPVGSGGCLGIRFPQPLRIPPAIAPLTPVCSFTPTIRHASLLL